MSTMSNESKSFKVLVNHPEVAKEGIDLLSRTCTVIQVQSLPPEREEILEKVIGVDAIIWAGRGHLNAEVLDAAGPQLRAISTMSAGLDFIDVDEIKRRKIPLGSTPLVLKPAVADIAVGLLISAARRFPEGHQSIKSWQNYRLNWLLGQDISGSVVGFFGFGSIGQAIAKRLSSFDIREVLYTTRTRLPIEIEVEYNANKVTFDVLLAKSDFLIIASPLTSETRGVFNAVAFQKMKKNAVLVNIARGPIVNQQDLYTALKTNDIFAAGLDVTDPEPMAATDPLLKLSNCIITPHMGCSTSRTRSEMAALAAQNVLKGLAGEPMLSPVY